MPGQFKTRRNPDTGRIERIPEEEQIDLRREAAQDVPAADPRQDEADAEFLQQAAQQEEEPAAEEEGEEEGGGGALGGAAAGAKAGMTFGPKGAVVGAVVGAGVGYLAGQSSKSAPIGKLEGGPSRGDSRDLSELLAVTKKIARAGTPIKDAILTKATNSRM